MPRRSWTSSRERKGLSNLTRACPRAALPPRDLAGELFSLVTFEMSETAAHPAGDRSSASASYPDALPGGDAFDVREEDAVAGVLRWLLMETDADAAAYLRLGPGGVEQLRVEPRGLDPTRVAMLASRAHEALMLAGREEHATTDAATTRWLGVGGSKVLVLEGIPELEPVNASLRFARFAIEWLAASRRGARLSVLEQRVRAVRGVVWAEVTESDPAQVRVMLSGQADAETTRKELQEAADGAHISIEGIEPEPSREPRARLKDLRMAMNSNATAEVRIEWEGRELKGLGRGRASPAGRLYAAALATADAMKPLLETDLDVMGLYETQTDHTERLLVVAMSVAGEPLVGAVRRGPGQDDASGVRAVLDAVNRRLARLAGRYGQI
jgi:hypothetical protein